MCLSEHAIIPEIRALQTSNLLKILLLEYPVVGDSSGRILQHVAYVKNLGLDPVDTPSTFLLLVSNYSNFDFEFYQPCFLCSLTNKYFVSNEDLFRFDYGCRATF